MFSTVKRMGKSLWKDERGFIISSELVLISTVGVLGLLVGMGCLRDAMIGEFRDVAGSIGALNQSYAFGGMSARNWWCCNKSWTAGSTFVDVVDGGVPAGFDVGPNPTVRTPLPVPPVPPPLAYPPPPFAAPPAVAAPPGGPLVAPNVAVAPAGPAYAPSYSTTRVPYPSKLFRSPCTTWSYAAGVWGLGNSNANGVIGPVGPCGGAMGPCNLPPQPLVW